MAYIDAENTFMKSVTLTTATTYSDTIDLGSKGPFVSPLKVDVKLTKKLTSGSVNSLTIQSASSGVFADEVKISVPASAPQTSKPCTLAQFHAPIKPGNRYIRMKVDATSPVGGEITATMQNGLTTEL